MNKIKLSTIFELDNLINNSDEFDSVTTNLELFAYVKRLVDYIDDMFLETSNSILAENLIEYLERFGEYPEDEHNKDVFEDDYDSVEEILKDLKTTLDDDIQSSYCYFIDDPIRDDNFEKRLKKIWESAMNYIDIEEYNVEYNLINSRKAFAFGLYNASAIHLCMATESYSRFFYSSLNIKGFTNHEELNWIEVIRFIKELRRTFKFPASITYNLTEIKNENRNKIMHSGKKLEDEETNKFIDLCFESIMDMNYVLKDYRIK